MKKIVKKTFPKTMFSSHAFFQGFWVGFRRVWEGFWEGFGGSWPVLGHFLAPFFGACIRNALQKGSWRLLGWIWLHFHGFGKVWEGLGKISEGFWRGFGKGLEGPKLQFSWTAFFYFVFWLLVLWEDLGRKQDALR